MKGGINVIKALANEDTLLRTHCCRHKCFPFARARNICCGHKFCVRDAKNVSGFVQTHFVSATNVSQFTQPKEHHGQQCVRNNVSSFTKALRHTPQTSSKNLIQLLQAIVSSKIPPWLEISEIFSIKQNNVFTRIRFVKITDIFAKNIYSTRKNELKASLDLQI